MGKEIVVKKNELIEGFSNLNFHEHKLICKLISNIDSFNQVDFKPILLTKKNLIEFLKLNRNYGKLLSIIKSIIKKEVLIKKENSFVLCNWFIVEVFDSTIEFRFIKDLKPYLIKLKDNFTQYDLKAIQDFTCKYSFKLFEIFIMEFNKQKSRKNVVKIKLDVLYIRKILFIEKTHNKMPHFIVRVIKPSISDINQYTNIYVSFEKILQGKATTGFEFTISANVSNKKLFEIDTKDKENIHMEFLDIWKLYPLRKGLNDVISKNKINACKIGIEQFKIYIDRYMNYVTERRKEFPTFNFMEGDKFFNGRYIDYTDENYQDYISNAQQNKPEQSNNFEQREYDDEFYESLYDNF